MSRRSTRKEAKQAEREAAAITHTKRVPAGVAAQLRQGDVDSASSTRIVQTKHRRFPTWLTEAFDQILAAQTGTGKRALVVIKNKPGPGKGARMIVCELAADWVDYNGT